MLLMRKKKANAPGRAGEYWSSMKAFRTQMERRGAWPGDACVAREPGAGAAVRGGQRYGGQQAGAG
jgi:hypothetical protein